MGLEIFLSRYRIPNSPFRVRISRLGVTGVQNVSYYFTDVLRDVYNGPVNLLGVVYLETIVL